MLHCPVCLCLRLGAVGSDYFIAHTGVVHLAFERDLERVQHSDVRVWGDAQGKPEYFTLRPLCGLRLNCDSVLANFHVVNCGK